MSTYLLTWNPKSYPWAGLEAQARKTAGGKRVDFSWSCGNTQRIARGDRLFLLKQGARLPKGLVASGKATSEVYEDDHWDEKKARRGVKASYVDAKWDTILNPENEQLLPVSAFQNENLPAVHWNTQRSGIMIPPEVALRMEALWSRHLEAIRGSHRDVAADNSDPDEAEFPEGAALYRLHRFRERNRQLAKQAKALALRRSGRIFCSICGFDFFETYGDVGQHFIECHHTIPISELQRETKTKLSDVVLVCSNCHRMLHRKRPWLRVADLQTLLHRR